jgi:hypothetical protein
MSISHIPNSLLVPLQSVPKLSTRNWVPWSQKYLQFFRGLGASWLIKDEGPENPPADKVTLDGQILYLLSDHIEPEYAYLANEATSVADAWKKLKARCNKNNMARRIEILREMKNITHDPSKSIDVYMQAQAVKWRELEALGCKVEEWMKKDYLLLGLHSSYHSIANTILSHKNEPSLDTITDTLATAVPMSQIHSEDTDDVEHAFATRAKFNKTGSQNGGSSRSFSKSSKSTSLRWRSPTNNNDCRRCGETGHISDNCIHDMPPEVKDWIMQGPKQFSASFALEGDTGDSSNLVREQTFQVTEELENMVLGHSGMGVITVNGQDMVVKSVYQRDWDSDDESVVSDDVIERSNLVLTRPDFSI